MFMFLKHDKATLELYRKCLPGDANIGHGRTKLQITSSRNGEQTLQITQMGWISCHFHRLSCCIYIMRSSKGVIEPHVISVN